MTHKVSRLKTSRTLLPPTSTAPISRYLAPPIEESAFALVTIIEVIEHVANPLRFVTAAAQALSPRGRMLITSPNIYSLGARMRFLLNGGLYYFEQSSAENPIEPDHIHPIVLEAYRRKILAPLNLSLARIWTLS